MGIWEHFRGKSRVMSERRMSDMSDGLREDAFLEDAMERYGDAVYRLALCRLGSRADAEDVYQDVFLRLLRDTTAFRDGEHLKAWLLRVTLHCCIDLRRSAWWKRTAPLEAAADAAAPLGEEKGALWQAVEALPTDLRTAVWLHYVEGYGTDEIAEIVSCRPATVRTRLHRARKKLQNMRRCADAFWLIRLIFLKKS
mgnify:CR=1 FL=1